MHALGLALKGIFIAGLGMAIHKINRGPRPLRRYISWQPSF